MASEVLDLFLELAAIASPSGEERPVADRVLGYLRDCGLTPDEDDTGPEVGSTMGNIYVALEPTTEGEPLFLCAHLDTVPPVDAIEPVVEDGIVRNRNEAILGGDNKAAVAAMLDAVRRVLAEGRPHAGIELLFTSREETGLEGAYAFDHTRLRARAGYVYDEAAPVGGVILGAPSAQLLEVSFHGRAAHAGMFPEEGRSAIAAAARAISEMPLGRIDEETTANVGTIKGGTAANVVPDLCSLRRRGPLARRAEARRAGAGDAGRADVRRRRRRVRGRDEDDADLHRVPVHARRPAGQARGRGARELRLRAASTGSPAAPPTRTSSTSAGSNVSISRTACPRSTPPTSTSPSPTSRRWSRSRSR